MTKNNARGVVLIKQISDLINTQSSILRREQALVASNLAAGQPRRGKNKLKLSVEDLARHELARETAAQAQHKLLLLVPILRKLKIAKQHGTLHSEKTNETLPGKSSSSGVFPVVGAKLFYHAASSDVRYPHLARLCAELLAAFPELLPDDKAVPEVKRKIARITVKGNVELVKSALYEKIKKAPLGLTPQEKDLLIQLFI